MHSTSSGCAQWKTSASFRSVCNARSRHVVTVSESRRAPTTSTLRSARKVKIAGRVCSLRSVDIGPAQHLRRWTSNPKPFILFKLQRGNSRLVVSATMISSQDSEAYLEKELPSHPELILGELENGLRYVIFPNKTPPNRFEAHLEVHAGSVNERSDQQGLAHLVEHVTFLGSPKRESLLGTGSRSNAYTDFHHTVFHVHCPLVNQATKKPMMPQVLDALKDVVFNPQFSISRIEKERRAVLSEAQMMNTIEYRVDCQMLKYLHQENALGSRFPIGKNDQIKTWDRDNIKEFWNTWYYPANMTLYIVGVLADGVEATKALIKETFGDVEINMYQENGSPSRLRPARQTLQPPVDHLWGEGKLVGQNSFPCSVNIFRHPLLQQFMLSIFCKIPVRPIKTYSDLKTCLMVRVLLSIFAHRINARYAQQDPPFVGIDLDISDSAREGCSVGVINITSEPKDWKGAVEVAVQETRRLQRHGVKKSELQQFLGALLKDTELSAGAMESISSSENLEYFMESIALDHKVVHPRTHHEAIVRCAQDVTVEEMKAMVKTLLTFGSDYGREGEILKEFEDSEPGEWLETGPVFATAVIACVPAFVDASGMSKGGGMPLNRGQSLMTIDHVDLDPTSANEELGVSFEEDQNDFEVPEGAIRFEISEGEIQEVMKNQNLDVEAEEDVEVPEKLIPEEEITKLMEERNPKFIALDGGSAEDPTTFMDPDTNVVFRRLSNGIRLNCYSTDAEPNLMLIRVVFPGGRLHEEVKQGSRGFGAVRIGVRGLSESGTAGEWNRSQTELYCISHLVNCSVDSTEEFMTIDFALPSNNEALSVALELLHLFIESPKWDESAVNLAKQMALSDYRKKEKSLEDESLRKVASSILGGDHRLLEPNPTEIEALTFEEMQKLVSETMNTSNMEVTFVGDFKMEELHQAALKYLGTIEAKPIKEDYLDNEKRVEFCLEPGNQRHQVWHLLDSDERACGYICGPAPARWGPFGHAQWPVDKPKKVIPPIPDPEGKDANPISVALATSVRRAHPLYPSITLALLKEIINSRLFTTVRDQLGLTYDVTFELIQLERHPTAWFTVHLTSSPEKIHETVKASVIVLQRMEKQKVTMRELLRAKRTLLTRHESDLQQNEYWLGLLTHLQSDQVPLKTVESLRDFKAMLTSISLNDLYDAYNRLDFNTNSLYTCIGTSGKIAPPARTLEQDMNKEDEASNGSLNGGSNKAEIKDPADIFKALASVISQKSTEK